MTSRGFVPCAWTLLQADCTFEKNFIFMTLLPRNPMEVGQMPQEVEVGKDKMKPVISSKRIAKPIGCSRRVCFLWRPRDSFPRGTEPWEQARERMGRREQGQKASACSQERQVSQVWGEVTPRRWDGRRDAGCLLNITLLPGLLHTRQAAWELSRATFFSHQNVER